MFLVRVFRGHQREPVLIHLVNFDMTPEQHFPELVVLLTLQQKNSRKSPWNGVVYYAIKTTGVAHTISLSYPRY